MKLKLRERAPLWRRVVRTLGRQLFRLAENNDDPRLTHNGEGWFLRQLLGAHAEGLERQRPFRVFDAGANAGVYTRLVREVAKATECAVEVHAFEPSTHCLEILRREFGAAPGVWIVGAALSDRVGEASLHDGKAGSSQASLVARGGKDPEAAGGIAVPLMRLGDYLDKQAITRVDFLKLDVEGSELAALRGLGERLRPEVVDAIQFEYGGTAIDAGMTLRDLYRLLESRGYVMAKLFPVAIEVRDYRPWMENYAYANYVALSPRWRTVRRGT
jgi:FkbM family methyltransferase